MKIRYGLVLGLCLLGASFVTLGGDFDGSTPILCASTDVMECELGEECRRVRPESVDAPQFIRIDAKANKISATTQNDTRVSNIATATELDGKLIMQGVEDGLPDVRDGVAWSLAIMQDSGKMVLTGSSDNVGFVIFGACTNV